MATATAARSVGDLVRERAQAGVHDFRHRAGGDAVARVGRRCTPAASPSVIP